MNYFQLSLQIQILYLVTGTVYANFLPEFVPKEETLIITLMEGTNASQKAAVVHKFRGIDLDGDSLTFTLGGGDPSIHEYFDIVHISNTESNLVLKKSLDRELKSEFILEVILTDGKEATKRTSQQSLLIIVADANDNNPKFKEFPANVTIPENSYIPLHILTLEATDLDEKGPHSDFIFILNPEPGDEQMFSLIHDGKKQGQISLFLVKSFDFEKKSLYNVNITAKDNTKTLQGTHLETTTTVKIIVQDMNDNLPFFNLLPGNDTKVPEDIPMGSIVFKVQAIDVDAEAGRFNKMHYQLLNEKDKFAINSSTGVVRTKMKFNTGEDSLVGMYSIIVKATELELTEMSKNKIIYKDIIPPAFVEAIVNIEITDVEEAPRFRNKSYKGTVPENSPPGLTVLLEKDFMPIVWDNDKNGKSLIRLRIEGKGKETFEVIPRQGFGRFSFQFIVKDNKLLDYEKRQEITFRLIAEDQSGNGVTCDCSVSIRDVNDNTPAFSKEVYHITISENPTAGFVLPVTIRAIDIDSDLFGTEGIRYTKLIGLASEELELNNETGVIAVKPPINRSTVFDREKYEQIFMTIEARDNLGTGNRNLAGIIIDIQDENDRAPVFDKTYLEVTIPEDIKDNTKIITVQAKDADVSTNHQRIRYNLVSTFDDTFQISQDSGVVSTNRFKWKFQWFQYTLEVYAIDQGGLQSAENCVVNVTVEKARHLNTSHFNYSTEFPSSYLYTTFSLFLNQNGMHLDEPNASYLYYVICGFSLILFNCLLYWMLRCCCKIGRKSADKSQIIYLAGRSNLDELPPNVRQHFVTNLKNPTDEGPDESYC